MKKFFFRLILLLLLLSIGLGIALEYVELPDATARVTALPAEGNEIVSTDLPLNDPETAFFGATRVLKRQYQIGKHRFFLLVIDLSRDSLSVRDPLYYFQGTGWDIRAKKIMAVPGGDGIQASLWRSTEDSEAVVWFSDGTVRHASGRRQWWQSILRRVTLGRSGGEPVLVILQPLPNVPVEWTQLFADFPALFSL